MVTVQTVVEVLGKVDAKLGRFRDNACKCLSDKCFADNGTVIITARQRQLSQHCHTCSIALGSEARELPGVEGTADSPNPSPSRQPRSGQTRAPRTYGAVTSDCHMDCHRMGSDVTTDRQYPWTCHLDAFPL